MPEAQAPDAYAIPDAYATSPDAYAIPVSTRRN
jgi:hypothetical protein